MMTIKGLRQISPYVAGKQPQEKNIIKLNTNENAYPPSPAVSQALKGFDTEQLKRYSSLEQGKLRQSLAKQLGVTSQQLIIGNGSDDILSLAFLAFFNNPEPIIFPDLTYAFYKVWAQLYQTPYQEIPLAEDFTIKNSDYLRPNGGIIITNPNAPTGIAKPLAEIEEILQANPEVVVIVDEAYISFGGETAIPLLNKYPNLFITRTFSKDASLAGLRVGYGIGSPNLIAVINAIKHSINPYSVDSLAENLAIAAVEDWSYYEERVEQIKTTRDWFRKELLALGFEVLPSSANFLLARPTAFLAEELFHYLESKKIYVRYYPNINRIKDHLRISIGSQAEMEQVIMTIQELC